MLYTFESTCSVTIAAHSENEARAMLIKSFLDQEEDVMYGDASVYIPSYGKFMLIDAYESDLS